MGFCDSQEKPNDKRKLNDKHKKERGAAVIHRPTAPRFYYGCVTQQNDDFEGKGIKPLLLSNAPGNQHYIRAYAPLLRNIPLFLLALGGC